MDKNGIIAELKDQNPAHVRVFVDYCMSLKEAMKGGARKNPWIQNWGNDYLASCFRKVASQGLVFDGKHIVLIPRGVSLDYVAYKNKMLVAYPESLVDLELVYEGDEFTFQKESGHVLYKHQMMTPFELKDGDIIAGYCVIKNKRGEFLTRLNKADITKHRKLAKSDKFWSMWFREMCLKTIMKKACKLHFDDIFTGLDEIDNESIDLSNPLDIDVAVKADIELIADLDALATYYKDNEYKYVENKSSFNRLVNKRKKEITEEMNNEDI